MFHFRAAALAIVLLLTSIGCLSRSRPEVAVRSRSAAADRSRPELAGRQFIATRLPRYMTLDAEFRDGGPQGEVTTVEQKLAELGARVGDDGELHDRDAKRIFFFWGPWWQGQCPGPEYVRWADNRLRDLQLRGTVIVMAPVKRPS